MSSMAARMILSQPKMHPTSKLNYRRQHPISHPATQKTSPSPSKWRFTNPTLCELRISPGHRALACEALTGTKLAARPVALRTAIFQTQPLFLLVLSTCPGKWSFLHPFSPVKFSAGLSRSFERSSRFAQLQSVLALQRLGEVIHNKSATKLHAAHV